MSCYLDTGLLIKLYVPEPTSAIVLAAVRSRTEGLAYTAFHDLELRNGLRAKLFRREINPTQLAGALAHVEADRQSDVLLATPFDWGVIRGRAESLSAQFTPQTGCRALDILHVAAALTSRASEFLTGDQRQAQFARLAGLNVTLM